MNAKKSISVIILMFALLLTTACGPSYNTDYPPPDSKTGPNVAFPLKIGDDTQIVTQINVPKPEISFQASYGGGKMIARIVQSPNHEAADEYFKKIIVPNFDAMKTHSRGKVNGRWSASGTDKDGRKWYGWVNKNWSFVINGADQDSLDKLVDALSYISK